MARGMVHLSGNLVLIRAHLIRALACSAAGLRVLMTRAFVRSAALAGALALAGCYAILFFPFGIWGLVVLYRPDVREQFRRPAPPRDDGNGEL